jgi:uncharacterized protein (DUF58 family)
MLSTAEIQKKVKELEIKSKKLTADLFTGEYHTAFRGRGMSFREVREYAAGDDVRFIDWNVSARLSHPFTKVFEEERELTVMLLIDISASSLFGSSQMRKRDLITEIGAVLSFSAINNQDKVGAIFFTDKVELYIPPKKGKQHALYIVRELLTAESARRGTNISEAIKYFTRSVRQKSIAFIMSDFLDNNYQHNLRVASNKHDVIGIKIYDKMDMQLPEAGLLEVLDPETGKTALIDSGNKVVRYNYEHHFMDETAVVKNNFKKAAADLLHIRTDEDYVKILQQFFIKRA